jgi:hypothetical protein
MTIWCLGNVKSKFVQKMEVYCGACHEDDEHATRYKNKNHIVTCDIFFSYPTLFQELLKVKVHATWIVGLIGKGCLML